MIIIYLGMSSFFAKSFHFSDTVRCINRAP